MSGPTKEAGRERARALNMDTRALQPRPIRAGSSTNPSRSRDVGKRGEEEELQLGRERTERAALVAEHTRAGMRAGRQGQQGKFSGKRMVFSDDDDD